jgi:hypothetical protein
MFGHFLFSRAKRKGRLELPNTQQRPGIPVVKTNNS